MKKMSIYEKRRMKDHMSATKMSRLEAHVRALYSKYANAYKRAGNKRTATVKMLHAKWQRELRKVNKMHTYYKL